MLLPHFFRKIRTFRVDRQSGQAVGAAEKLDVHAPALSFSALIASCTGAGK